MKCSTLALSLLVCSSISYGDTGHDIRDHSDLMEDSFCIGMYSYALQLGPTEKEARALEVRGRGLAVDMLRKALSYGHSKSETEQMLSEVIAKMYALPLETSLRFAEYIDCAGRTEKYVSVFKY